MTPIPGLPKPTLAPEDLNRFLVAHFSEEIGAKDFRVTKVEHGGVELAFAPRQEHLRPGETVAGPVLFAITDVAAYVAIIAHSGPHNLQAVTTSAQTNFLVRPSLGPLRCEGRLMKLGRRLAVVDAVIYDQDGKAVVSASLTYALPPASSSSPAGTSQS